MKGFVTLFVLLVAAFAAAATAAAQPAMLEQAIAVYSEAMDTADRSTRLQKFAKSEQLFRQVLEASTTDSTSGNVRLLVNLGNAALQAEHIGSAIVAYRQALLLDPDDRQALQNLQYARSTLPDAFRTQESDDWTDTLFFWQSMYARSTILAASAVCFFAASMMFAVGFVRRLAVVRNAAILPAAGWLVLLLSATMSSGGGAADDEAVLVVDGVILRAADSENAPPRLSTPLPDGAELVILQQRERWTEIQINNRSGWVPTASVARIRP